MDRQTAPSENNRGPSVSAPEPLNQTADHAVSVRQAPVQTTLFNVEDFIPEGDTDEAAETYYRATVLRDYLIAVGPGTFEAAIAWAGLPPLPKGQTLVVNCRAPIEAMKKGWAIPSGGICRSTLARQAHRGRIGHYRCPTSVMT